MELKADIGSNLEARFHEELHCIAVSPDFSRRGAVFYFTAESIAKLAAFSQRVQLELASRQNLEPQLSEINKG